MDRIILSPSISRIITNGRGLPGQAGEEGEQGPQGPQGPPGDSVISDPGDLTLIFENALI